MEDDEIRIKADLHEGNWEVKLAEVRLRGNSLLNTWYPLLASILSHIGQTAVLASRSAKMCKDKQAFEEHMNLARLVAAVRTTIALVHEGGPKHASKQMERVTEGEIADPSDMAIQGWITSVGELPPMHIPMMDKRVLLAMRILETDDTIRLHFDETLCGKNLHDPDDDDAQEALRIEMEKQEKRMGITNNVPPIVDKSGEVDGYDEDGTKTTTKDIGGFVEVRKTRERDKDGKPKPATPKKPDPKDKKSLDAFLDEMLSKKAEEADKRAKEAKDKQDGKEYRGRNQIGDDDEPLPPSRFN
ncbi:hypothetical protein UFOVP477_15 [uncultured Caudovirales phage]|uniref:Uncharacterized protein n=1 Tax=uncultured Caudovirales phage TaxID=2100421 RepID=A0A6J5NUF2_9CAUD|nr:hypothetical protein UFOVP477_15 [uncultured Caudovirales phage]CAB4163350.1 hypothetical protein UFOVP798_19 [uncultured Caudovirales phage]CAB4191563.1 hypothetical protein UFOVP1222_45 [uncultured Caudovirales phage]